MNDEGLADAAAANPFVYPDFTQELVEDMVAETASTHEFSRPGDP